MSPPIKHPRIRESLAIATCTLLATAVQPASAENHLAPWEIDSALLIYAEKDRVQLAEPILNIRKEIADAEYVSVRMIADALTGASPTGAIATNTAQTFTRPSGSGTYTVPAGETPLDDSFRDIRAALSINWEKPLGDKLTGAFGFNFSKEFDYTSLGISSTFTQEFNQRHTTLTFALSMNQDDINPVGNVPVGLTPLPVFPDIMQTQGQNKQKTVNELLLGVSQIINRHTLMQWNYSYGKSDGYLTDPYKILSVLENDGSGNLRTGSSPYVLEKRPDSRVYQSIYWKSIHQSANENVTTLSYRFFWDDWDISSHTIDFRYRWDLSPGYYLQPHIRYYQQNKAYFYRQTLTDGEEQSLDYASADHRLGSFTTRTLGIKYGIEFDNGAEINLRIETMMQRGKTLRQDAVGSLENNTLYPDLDAIIIQGGISINSDSLVNLARKYLNRYLPKKWRW